MILNWLRGIAVNHGMWDNLLCSGILSLLWLFSWLLTIGGILFFLLEILASSGSYKAAMQTYEQALALRERSITRSKTYRDIVEKDDKKLKEIQTRLEDMEKLRDRLYQINVIPVMYRNSQSIHFMKNFFRKHGNTDLDEAVRQMLIQKAIKNTDELEYGAERSVSNQEKQNMLQDQIQREHSELMEGVDMELDSIEASQERQEKYLKMMESTSLMAAFFAAE